jgi:phosphoglycerate dehydrogenase-like enzyme
MKFRLHLESRRAQAPSFHLDQMAWDVATQRHQHLAGLVDVTFGWDGEALNESLMTADALLASKFDKAVVNRAPKLRWIHTTGAGVDQLMPLSDLRHDLVLSNSSGIHGDKAGESALMALLMLNARIPEVVANQRTHTWASLMTQPVHGKKALLIGFGEIGQAVGKMIANVGVRVVAITRSGKASVIVPDIPVVTTARLDELLPDADFVIVTAPLTNETKNLLSASRLSLLKSTAGLINMARAPLIDYTELVKLLENGRLNGAVLDVFENEPLRDDSPFWDVPRLIVLPHITCDAPDYNQRVLDIWFDNFERLRTGKTLRNQVDRVSGY